MTSEQTNTPPNRLHWLALAAIILLATLLRFYGLGMVDGEPSFGNRYYAAGVESMTQSFHNFFFVAAEPGASVSIDKPPLGLWLQVISAMIFGVNGFALMLPQALAGVLGIPLIYHLITDAFDRQAGLIAALVLAITPVAISADRNNTMDSTLILTLTLSAWMFLKSIKSGKLKFLWAGAALVGVAFNIKMMQAFLPLPAMFAAYFLVAPHRWWKKLIHLGAATLLLLVISFAWVIAVDLTPPENRPYVGSSENNTALELVFGHNGLKRLINTDQQSTSQPQRPAPQGQAPTIDGTPFGSEVGSPGLFRLFSEPLSREVSWLLPFGLLALLLTLPHLKLSFPLSYQGASLILWGGALLTAMVFFSVANLFHAYYMIMLASPLAAAVGIGLWGIRQHNDRSFWLGTSILITLALITLVFQTYLLGSYTAQRAILLPLMMGLFFAGGAGVIASAMIEEPDAMISTFSRGMIVVSMLVVVFAWSLLTTLNPDPNENLPRSGPAPDYQDAFPSSGRSLTDADPTLIDYLERNTADIHYLVGVSRASFGAPFVLATGRPVLYMGGFSNNDEVVSPADLDRMLTAGEIRYFYFTKGRDDDIQRWIFARCTPIPEFDVILVPVDNAQPPPPGLPPGANEGPRLYDCAMSE